jgi:hypothetical protein
LIFIVLTHWNNSPQEVTEMMHHSRHIYPSMSQHFFIPECCMLSEEAANTHFIGKLGWFDKIYDNEVKHANHDITEAEN